MWNGVTAGVAHLVFLRGLLDMFGLIGDARLDIVVACTVGGHELQTYHVGSQVVAGMFHIGAYTQILARLCVVQPVLAEDIVRLLLFGVEG